MYIQVFVFCQYSKLYLRTCSYLNHICRGVCVCVCAYVRACARVWVLPVFPQRWSRWALQADFLSQLHLLWCCPQSDLFEIGCWISARRQFRVIRQTAPPKKLSLNLTLTQNKCRNVQKARTHPYLESWLWPCRPPQFRLYIGVCRAGAYTSAASGPPAVHPNSRSVTYTRRTKHTQRGDALHTLSRTSL